MTSVFESRVGNAAAVKKNEEGTNGLSRGVLTRLDENEADKMRPVTAISRVQWRDTSLFG